MRFLMGWLILGVAIILQIAFPYHGIVFDFTFAALIAFAGIFDFWELLCFVLASVFILNWQPALSWPIAIIGIYPFIVWAFCKTLRWEGWFGILTSVIVGFISLALASNTRFLSTDAMVFFVDLTMGIIFAILTFWLFKEKKY